jgi:exonuclease VII small subunit
MGRAVPDNDTLETLVTRLEQAAVALRAGDLEPERATGLADECARLAAEAGAELDRQVREGERGTPVPGQLALGQ